MRCHWEVRGFGTVSTLIKNPGKTVYMCAWGGFLSSLFACAFGSYVSVPHGMFPGNWSSCVFEAYQVLHHLASGVRVFVWGWLRVMEQRTTDWVERWQISFSVCFTLLILAVAPSCCSFWAVMTRLRYLFDFLLPSLYFLNLCLHSSQNCHSGIQ